MIVHLQTSRMFVSSSSRNIEAGDESSLILFNGCRRLFDRKKYRHERYSLRRVEAGLGAAPRAEEDTSCGLSCDSLDMDTVSQVAQGNIFSRQQIFLQETRKHFASCLTPARDNIVKVICQTGVHWCRFTAAVTLITSYNLL